MLAWRESFVVQDRPVFTRLLFDRGCGDSNGHLCGTRNQRG